MNTTWSNVGGGIRINFQACLSQYPSVYRGKLVDDPENHQQVAVKRLMFNLATKVKTEKEIRVMLKLGKNKNTVKYLRSSISNDLPDLYIAMELCRKETLESFIQQHKLELTYKMKQKILTHIALGVDHIHENKIVHGSLNPTNIMQSLDRKTWKISGFGLSRPVEKSCPSTSAKRKLDRQDWRSPEHYSRQKTTLKTDIFLLGLTIYYVLTGGKHAFGEDAGQRKSNITVGQHRMNLDDLSHPTLTQDLLEKMVLLKPENRPSIKQILRHPLLWEEKQKAKYMKSFQNIWNQLSSEQKTQIEKDHNMHVDVYDENNVLLFYSRATLRDASQASSLIPQLHKIADEIEYSDFPETELSQEKDSYEKYEGLAKECNSLTINDDNDNQVDIVDIGNDALIYLLQRSEDTWVFQGELKEVVNQPAVFKAMENSKENWKSITVLREVPCANVVSVKRTIQHAWPSGVPHISNQVLPQAGQDLIWLVMDTCSSLEKIEQNSSFEHTKRIGHHIVYALHSLHEEHKIVHGNISLQKICKSEDGKEVVLLGSKRMVKSEDVLKKQTDLQSAAKVICILMCKNCRDQQDISWRQLKTEGDLLEACKNIDAEYKEIFEDFLSQMWKVKANTKELLGHPFFWHPGRKIKFLCKVSDYFEKQAKWLDSQLKCPKNWIEALKFEDDERRQWFAEDDDGIIYKKASAKNSQFEENSAWSLLRLMRNALHHVPTDIEKYMKKHKLIGEQKLFINEEKDIGKFFLRRFPTFFYDAYCFIRRDRDQFGGHFDKYFNKIVAKPKLA